MLVYFQSLITIREMMKEKAKNKFEEVLPYYDLVQQIEKDIQSYFSTLRGMAMNELFKMPKEASAKQLKMLADFVATQCR